MLGARNIFFSELKNIFFDKTSFLYTIIFSLRLPRSILAMISGALLAGSGACFQMFFRNSLAEPGIIGVSAGATLGAVVAQTFGLSSIFFGLIAPINIFAFIGSLLSGVIIVVVSSKSGKHNSTTLLLCGTAFGTFYSSISSIILLTKNQNLHGIYTWILGSFNGRGWNEVKFIILPAVISILFMILSSRKLDVMIGGENSAESLGVNTKKLRINILFAASLAVSVSVCAGGTINFVGLISPHIVKKIYGPKYSRGIFIITLSMIFGAILVLASDTFARVIISPAELPAGIITSILGAPFFLSLIFTRKGENI